MTTSTRMFSPVGRSGDNAHLQARSLQSCAIITATNTTEPIAIPDGVRHFSPQIYPIFHRTKEL